MSSLQAPTIVEVTNAYGDSVNINFTYAQTETDPTVASLTAVIPNTNFSKSIDISTMSMMGATATLDISLADLGAGGVRSGTFSFDLYFTDSNGANTSAVTTNSVTRHIQPDAPTGAFFTTPEDWSANNTIQLGWSYNSMDQLTGYKVYNDVGSPPTTVDTMNRSAEIPVNSSYAGKTPKFSIVAVGQYGESDPLEITLPFVINGTFNAPSAPQNLTVVLSGGTAHVTWDPPADTGGSITGYNLAWSDSENNGIGMNNDIGGAAVAYDVNDLTLESYIFTISAKNSLGSGEIMSVNVSASTPVSSNLVISQSAAGILLSWTGIPASLLNAYEVSSDYVTAGKRTNYTSVLFTPEEINRGEVQTFTFTLTTEYSNPAVPFHVLSGSFDFTGWPSDVTYDSFGWSSDPTDMVNHITNTIYDQNGSERNGDRRPEISSFTAEVVPFQGIKLTWGTSSPGTMESFLISIGSFSRSLAFGHGVSSEVTLITVDDLVNSVLSLLTPGATLTFGIGIQFADQGPPTPTTVNLPFNGFGLLSPSLNASFTDSLQLNFVAPALLFGEITLYKLTCPTVPSVLIEIPINSSAYSISINDLVAYGLTNGTYELVLTATDSYGQTSSASASVDIVLAPPAATNVIAYRYGTEITVEWESSFDCRLFRNGVDVAFGGSPAVFEVTSEDYNQQYTYRVVAENEYGSSTGVEVTLSIVGAIKEPSEPTNVGLIPKNNGALLTWETPYDTGNEVTGYTITIFDGTNIIDLSADASLYQCRITGLTNETEYEVSIRTQNSLGASSVVTNSVTPAKTVPDAPVIVVGRGDKSVKLSWEAPDDGGHPITGYRIQKCLIPTEGVVYPVDSMNQIYENGDVLGEYVDVATTLNLTYTITGLTVGSIYTFRVFSVNQLGDSLSAITEQILVLGLPSVPLNFRVLEKNDSERRISTLWDESTDNGGSSITGYLFTILYNGISQLEVMCPPGSFNTKAEQLDANVDVTYTVASVNEIGNSALVTLGPFRFALGDPTGVPFAPSDITVVPGATSALVSWTPVIGATGYKIYCNPDNKLANLAVADATSLNVTGLKNGTSYTFAVVAMNEIGSSYMTGCTPSTLPGVPKVTVVGGNGQVTLSWVSKPAAGVPTTSYAVTCNQSDAVLPENPTSPITISGLTNGRPYIFSLTATNVIGTSLAGAAKAVIPTSVPSVPNSFAVLVGTKSFQVTWAPPTTDGGLALTEYPISYTTAGKTTVAKAKPVSPYTLMVTKLATGTYTVSMQAKNKLGLSAATEVITVTVA